MRRSPGLLQKLAIFKNEFWLLNKISWKIYLRIIYFNYPYCGESFIWPPLGKIVAIEYLQTIKWQFETKLQKWRPVLLQSYRSLLATLHGSADKLVDTFGKDLHCLIFTGLNNGETPEMWVFNLSWRIKI